MKAKAKARAKAKKGGVEKKKRARNRLDSAQQKATLSASVWRASPPYHPTTTLKFS
jgi:hypothetical protein